MYKGQSHIVADLAIFQFCGSPMDRLSLLLQFYVFIFAVKRHTMWQGSTNVQFFWIKIYSVWFSIENLECVVCKIY